jgi:small subunit ribosomal protein S13
VLRISGRVLANNKKIPYALAASVYGIGIRTGFEICEKAGVDPRKRISEIAESEGVRIREIVEADHTTEGDLRRIVMSNIKKKKELGSYEGLRHRNGLPVRGQNTHNNARTRKGKAVSIAGKKKITK